MLHPPYPVLDNSMAWKKNIFTWEEDAPEICALIENSPTTLRIILKTKDDELLIERWINHYINIVDKKSDIIIFDNMTTNKNVLDVYQKYMEKIVVIRYSCYFNELHDVNKFSNLYSSIWKSSKFYTFIDTDEFLYLYDRGSVISGNAIVDFLDNSIGVNFFPTFWLKNMYYRDDVFIFKENIEYIRYLAAMGKPILNSEKARKCIRNIMIHALHMPLSIYGKSPCCFLLLHLNMLSKSQRIRTNMNKLVQHGLIRHAHDFKTVLGLNLETVNHGVFRYFVREIRALLAAPDVASETIGPGHVALQDGALQFYPLGAKKIFDRYVNKDMTFFELLDLNPALSKSPDTLIWELFDNDSYQPVEKVFVS